MQRSAIGRTELSTLLGLFWAFSSEDRLMVDGHMASQSADGTPLEGGMQNISTRPAQKTTCRQSSVHHRLLYTAS